MNWSDIENSSLWVNVTVIHYYHGMEVFVNRTGSGAEEALREWIEPYWEEVFREKMPNGHIMELAEQYFTAVPEKYMWLEKIPLGE